MQTDHSIQTILSDPDYLTLKQDKRHFKSNTYDHSVRTARIAGKIAGYTGVDQTLAKRAGLLHDYTHSHRHMSSARYLMYHPEDAAYQAEERFGITQEEFDAIRSHMFPFSRHMPNSKLAWILSISDKIASVEDLFQK